jgi:hypothetical protein
MPPDTRRQVPDEAVLGGIEACYGLFGLDSKTHQPHDRQRPPAHCVFLILCYALFRRVDAPRAAWRRETGTRQGINSFGGKVTQSSITTG